MSSFAHRHDPAAVLLALGAGLGLLTGVDAMTAPHLILGLVMLSFANQLDRAVTAHRMVRASCLLLILATLIDGFLIATDVYDLEPSAQPFRMRWVGYLFLWFVLLGNQSDQREGAV
ncbi:MAG: hypothetical protein CMJ94_12065 [Planctomycetes bacterium]|nr:hypothetical protein [Planctomycetota bacterium]